MNAAYLSVDETAALLRVDRKSIYKAIRSQRLPALQVGRTLRVAVADLQALAVDPTTGGSAAPRRRTRPREAVGEFTQRARGGVS